MERPSWTRSRSSVNHDEPFRAAPIHYASALSDLSLPHLAFTEVFFSFLLLFNMTAAQVA